MFVHDFISWYPEISDPCFGSTVNRLQEFKECALSSDAESLSVVPGTLLPHQTFVSRFLSLATPYDGLLLYHEMGTGKTCSAVAAIEQIRNQFPRQFTGALILARGFGLINNFIDEIAFKCTDGRYLPENKDVGDKLYRMRTKKKIEEFYTFETFERFSKNIRDVSPTILRKRFENFVIVIDEVHNIRDKTQDASVYDTIHKFLHRLERKRVILLSGTPMKDGCEEIASVMNLLLPIQSQLPTDVKFLETFFKNTELQNVERLKQSFRGRVSFLKSKISNVEKIDVGTIHPNLCFLKTISLVPSDFHKRAYAVSHTADMTTSNIYTQSRQASLMVFPDGSCGKSAFKKWRKNSNFWQGLRGPTVSKTIENISVYSVKYAAVIRSCLEAVSRQEISFVYSDIVNGSGLLALAKLLDICGFTRRLREPKSYVLLTSAVSESEKSTVLRICNAPENWNASQVAVILGSRVMMEGFTFNNIRHEHILTPHWNFSETSQIIARGWRLGSHHDLEQRSIVPTVSIYKYVLDLPDSIDIMMYSISERKDVAIRKITSVLQESAVDCFLNKKRNVLRGYDYERECNYGPCDYRCDAEDEDSAIVTNYEKLYFQTSTEWKSATAMLTSIFSKHFTVSLQDICRKSVSRLALAVLLYYRENGIALVNPMGQIGYLQNRGDVLFLATEPGGKTECDDFPQRPLPNFLSIVDAASNTNLIMTLKLFLSRKMTRESTFDSLRSFPVYIQEKLVEKCCKSYINQSTKKMALRQTILDYFHTLYTTTNTSFGLFFQTPLYFVSDSKKNWRPACKKEIDVIIAKRNKDLHSIHQNETGFYGQENRTMNEFCIRHVANISDTDKRKIQSGRRCVNWNKTDLVNLANKLIGPNHWEEKSRSDMCKILQKWFTENNLIEQDLTCGLQTKKKEFHNDINTLMT